MDADASAKKPQVPFEEFSKLDLRVAKIVDAQPVAGADKLYRLTLRLGAEERVIVSGIADFYAPDELFGKKLVVVEPAAEENTRRGLQRDASRGRG